MAGRSRNVRELPVQGCTVRKTVHAVIERKYPDGSRTVERVNGTLAGSSR